MYWRDFWADTGHLSPIEGWAYINLIGAYWTSGAPLANDDARLCRQAKVSAAEWRKVRATVIEFFNVSNDCLSHSRIDAELAAATEAYNRRRAHIDSVNHRKRQLLSAVTVAVNETVTGTQPQPHSTYVETKEANASLVRERPPKKSTSLPEGWIPNERNVSDAEARGYSAAHIRELAEHFRDHHRAKGTTSKDWDASWRTWLANDKRFNPERLGRGRTAGNRSSPGNIVDVVARLKAKADLEGQNDGRGMGRGGDGLRASGEHSGGNDGEGAGAGGIVLEADEASRMYRAAWGVEAADGAEAGIDGQHGGTASGVLPEADGIPVGRGAEGSHDAGGSQQMVAGLGGVEGTAGIAHIAAAEAFGGDDLEIPDFLDRRREIAGRA